MPRLVCTLILALGIGFGTGCAPGTALPPPESRPAVSEAQVECVLDLLRMRGYTVTSAEEGGHVAEQRTGRLPSATTNTWTAHALTDEQLPRQAQVWSHEGILLVSFRGWGLGGERDEAERRRIKQRAQGSAHRKVGHSPSMLVGHVRFQEAVRERCAPQYLAIDR